MPLDLEGNAARLLDPADKGLIGADARVATFLQHTRQKGGKTLARGRLLIG